MSDNDDYLWRKTGPADPEIARLERLLAPHAWRPSQTTSEAPVAAPAPPIATPRSRRPRVVRAAWAMAASLAMCAIAAGWLDTRLYWPEGDGWRITATQGDVRWTRTDAPGPARLTPGSELVTGRDGHTQLRVARIGSLRLAPDSRLRLEETRTGRHRVRLLHGRLHARIWAPPQQFGVSLPGAQLWDLGCEFVVDSDARGNGTLTVLSGWVMLDDGHSEVLVPRDARIAMRDGIPLGTPYDLGASPAFLATLRAIDANATGLNASDPLIERLVSASRPNDAISLLSLLQRHPHLAQGPIFDRLRELLPGDAEISREAVASGEALALDPWWDALPYPRVKQWWWQWRDALPVSTFDEKSLSR